MEIEQADRALGLLGTGSAGTSGELRNLNLRTLDYQVDGVFAAEALDRRDSHAIVGDGARSILGNIDHGDLTALPGGVGIRAVKHHVDLEGAAAARGQEEVEAGAVAPVGAGKGLDTLSVLGQAAEAEVLEADDAAVGETGEVHIVVPDIMVVLDPVLVGHIAGVTG